MYGMWFSHIENRHLAAFASEPSTHYDLFQEREQFAKYISKLLKLVLDFLNIYAASYYVHIWWYLFVKLNHFNLFF